MRLIGEKGLKARPLEVRAEEQRETNVQDGINQFPEQVCSKRKTVSTTVAGGDNRVQNGFVCLQT